MLIWFGPELNGSHSAGLSPTISAQLRDTSISASGVNTLMTSRSGTLHVDVAPFVRMTQLASHGRGDKSMAKVDKKAFLYDPITFNLTYNSIYLS